MNYKIEIIGSAVVITNTTLGAVHAEFPSRDIYYTVQKLIVNDIIYLYDTNGTNSGGSAAAFEAPLANVVDPDDVAFTVASFRTFAQANLAFNIGGSPAGSGAAAFKFTAVNYTDLITNVAPTADEGDLAYVYNSQGIWLVNRKLRGMWQYQTGSWIYANQELQTILQDKLDNVLASTGISIDYTNPREPIIINSATLQNIIDNGSSYVGSATVSIDTEDELNLKSTDAGTAQSFMNLFGLATLTEIGVVDIGSGTGQSILMDLVVMMVSDTTNSKGLQYLADYSAIGKLDPLWIPNYGTIKDEIDLPILATSTGVTEFDGLSTGIGVGTYILGATKGWIIDNTTDPDNPAKLFINEPAEAEKVPSNILTNPVTYIGRNAGGVVEKTVQFTAIELRSTLFLGVVVHSDNVNVNAINNLPLLLPNPFLQFVDIFREFGIFGSGNDVTPNGANLSINKAIGTFVQLGVNFENQVNNPDVKALVPLVAPAFRYRDRNSNEGGDTAFVDPTQYDNAGVLTAVPNNKWTVQRFYIFSSNIIRAQWGQTVYNTKSDALQALNTETFVIEPNMDANGMFIVYLIVKKEATDLSDSGQADFQKAPRFKSGSSSGGTSVSNMQQTYENSLNPEITTDDSRQAVSFKRGTTGGDSDIVIEVLNGVGALVGYITGEGDFIGDAFNGAFLTDAGAGTLFLSDDGTYKPVAGGGGLTSQTNAQMLALVAPTAGDQVFNTTWGVVYTYDGDVWLTPQLMKATNQNAGALQEGYVVIQDGTVADGIDLTTTVGSIAIVGVVKDIYGGGATGTFCTVAINGVHNVLYAGAVNIGEGAISDNVAGQANGTGTGQAGMFGVVRGSKGAPSTALILTILTPTERF